MSRTMYTLLLLMVTTCGLTATSVSANEPIWNYTVSALPGQTFNTLSEAEAALKGISPSHQNLEVINEYVSSTSVTKDYAVFPAAPTHEPSKFISPYDFQTCYSDTDAARQAGEDLNAGPNCPYSWILKNDRHLVDGFYPPEGYTMSYCGGVSADYIKVWGFGVDIEYYREAYSGGQLICAGPYYGGLYTGVREIQPLNCQDGYTYDWRTDKCVNRTTAQISGTLTQYCTATRGNPCSPATGDKIQTETDLQLAGLSLKRTYHSQQQIETHSALGAGWYGTYNRRLLFSSPGSTVVIAAVLGTGYVEPLKKRPYSDNYVPYSGSGFTIDPDGNGGYILRTKSGETEYYDSKGILQRILGNDQMETQLTYDADARLGQVNDNFGNVLTFAYDQATGHLASVTDQTGRAIGYIYDSNNNLAQASYPDQTTRRYHYEDPRHANLLTGITDQNDNRFATYVYDEMGRVISSEHTGGAGRITLDYNSDGTTTVTDSLGGVKVYIFNTNDPGIRKPTWVASPNSHESYEYHIPAWDNPQLRIKRHIDANGGQTSYTYDTHNLTVKTLAEGTAQAKRIEYSYDPRFYSKLQTVTEPSVSPGKQKITTYGYDDLGNRTEVSIDGYRPDGTPVSRTTTYQYNGPFNQRSQINGPRNDVADITRFEYYPDEETAGHNRARLKAVINPLGHPLRDEIQYSGTGKVLSEIRPNGVSFSYTYEADTDRLLSLTLSAQGVSRTSGLSYWPSGEVKTITQAEGLPEEIRISFEYDAARRLTGIADAQGNSLDYILDSEGNRLETRISDPSGILRYRQRQVYNQLGQLIQSVDANNHDTDYAYDANDNLTQTTDARQHVTQQDYDILDRLQTITDALNGTTQYTYDSQDNITGVTDPTNLTTTYVYDDLGNLTSQTSPNTGTITYTYDEAGNRLSQTDARGVTLTYTYDALNRLTQVSYPDSSLDVIYTYDQGLNGIGRLTGMSDANGTTSYSYNGFVNVSLSCPDFISLRCPVFVGHIVH